MYYGCRKDLGVPIVIHSVGLSGSKRTWGRVRIAKCHARIKQFYRTNIFLQIYAGHEKHIEVQRSREGKAHFSNIYRARG